MKYPIKYCVLVFGLIIFLAGCFQKKDSNQLEITETYLENIAKLTSGNRLEGPDKATFRNIIMTMNPETGHIPKIKTSILKKREKARLASSNYQWKQVNTEIAGRVRVMMIDPLDDQKLWAGAATGGLWYNSDFRNDGEWVPVSDKWDNMSIGSMCFDPQEPDVFYVGTGESFTSVNIYRESTSSGIGIYKSTDGGISWTLLSSTADFDYVNDVLARVENGVSVLYAAVASGIYQGRVFDSQPSDGIYRSTDGGQSWEMVLSEKVNDGSFSIADLEMTESRIYAGTMRNLEVAGGGRIFSSLDGINWDEEGIGYTTDVIQEGKENYGLDLIPGRVKLTASGNYVYAALTSGWKNNFNQIRDHPVFTRLMRKDELTGEWQYLVQPETSWASIPWHAMAMAVDPSDPRNLTIGGLDLYNNVRVSETGELAWIKASDWVSMYGFSPYLVPYYGLQGEADSLTQHFVHADIHAILFGKSSDELIVATDGGIQFSEDYSKVYAPLEGDRLLSYPTFRHINQGFASTQYYTIAINPVKNSEEVLAGSQDNSTHTSETGEIKYASMIGGGDGAYCFFDRDDPQLRITSSQSNAYNIWIDDVGNYLGLGTGTFINPGAYDDRSNLLYVNMMVDGGFEALNVELQGRFIDTLGILNLNSYLNKDTLSLDRISFLKIGSGSQAAFSAMKTSPYDDALDATLLLGNQLGDVYLVKGLPYSPSSAKIDNNQLPVGYISAVDFGESNDDILVSFSNYGVPSVWVTRDGGSSWTNLDRDLPDVPVRDAHFSPYDDRKIIIATEIGIWGLENTNSEEEGWVHYNEGLPNVRVDMLDIRESDSTIAIATHGRGVFTGKYQQGEPIVILSEKERIPISSLEIYPNPTSGIVHFTDQVNVVDVFTLSGTLVRSIKITGNSTNLSSLSSGVYLIRIQQPSGQVSTKRIVKRD